MQTLNRPSAVHQRGATPSCSHRQQLASVHRASAIHQRRAVVVRAVDEDAELEKRLEKLKKSNRRAAAAEEKKTEKKKPSKPVYDFTDEVVHYEGPPHRGDLAVNVALGTTLVWLPLTIAAVGRSAYVNYRFTNKRLTVTTTAPWKNETLSAAYQEVKDVRTVGRGVGLWGDMVVELNDGSKIELRSLDRFKELEAYIKQRKKELSPPEVDPLDLDTPVKTGAGKGFA